MILADEITCRIATPDAVKVELINCSTSLIDSAKGFELFWVAVGAIGAFGAMIITLFMARYAWKAWKTSESQLELTREIALEQQRLPALTDFLKALRPLIFIDTSLQTSKDAGRVAREATLLAELWSISYPKLFKSRIILTVIAALENDASRCYQMVAANTRNSEFIQSQSLIHELSMSAQAVNRLFNVLTKAAYDLHRREIEEAEAIELLKEGLSEFHLYWKASKR